MDGTSAISINDYYQPYVTAQVGGGVQGAIDVNSGAAAMYGTGAAQASPTGISWTFGVLLTLAVIAYLVLL